MNKIIIDNIEYTVDNNSACIVKCAADSVSVVIPSDITVDRVDYPVTTIGYNAFSGCESLTRVALGNGVTSIGLWAFYRCTSLEKISIPDSVQSIGDYAFWCTSLKKAVVSKQTLFQENTFPEHIKIIRQ